MSKQWATKLDLPDFSSCKGPSEYDLKSVGNGRVLGQQDFEPICDPFKIPVFRCESARVDKRDAMIGEKVRTAARVSGWKLARIIPICHNHGIDSGTSCEILGDR
jgi:hypothetical protein